MELTQEQLRETFTYREDGEILWLKNRTRSRVGTIAGTYTDNRGYKMVNIKNKPYKRSQVIFKYHHGYLPEVIDHKNRIRTDDRIENLRSSDRTQNARNVSLDKRNISGKTGVTWDKARLRWCAKITVKGQSKSLGRFSSIHEARDVRREAELKHFGEYSPT